MIISEMMASPKAMYNAPCEPSRVNPELCGFADALGADAPLTHAPAAAA